MRDDHNQPHRMGTIHHAIATGPQVLLTPLHMQNVGTHFRWNNDPDLNRLDSELPFAEERYGAFLQRFGQLVHRPAPDACDFEIHTRTGTLIGTAFVDQIRRTHGHGRVSVTICEQSHWGRGYGREALGLLLDYAFDHLGLRRLTAEAFAFNGAWRHLLARSGFQREAQFRDYLHRDGRFWDKEVYGLLRHDHQPAPAPHRSSAAARPVRSVAPPPTHLLAARAEATTPSAAWRQP